MLGPSTTPPGRAPTRSATAWRAPATMASARSLAGKRPVRVADAGAVGAGDRVDHRLRDLRAGGTVEVGKAVGQGGIERTDVIDGEGHGRQPRHRDRVAGCGLGMAEGMSQPGSDAPQFVVVDPRGVGRAADRAVRADPGQRGLTDLVEQPALVMRIGSMIKQLLEEVRGSNLDEASRTRLRDIHSRSIQELERGPGPRADRGTRADLAAVHRRRGADRGGAADRPGPARGLARGAVPRDPDRAVRPAGPVPRGLRGDAPPRSARRVGRRAGSAGRAGRSRSAGPGPSRLHRPVPLTPSPPRGVSPR